MRPFASMAGASLQCTQPSVWKQEFELNAGDTRLGSFRFRDVFKWRAEAESSEGTWTFERRGLWKPRVIIRDHGEKTVTEIAWNMAGEMKIRCTMARILRLKRVRWRSDYDVTTDMNFPLMHIRRQRGLKTTLEIRLTDRAGRLRELPWVLLFAVFTCLSDASGKGG